MKRGFLLNETDSRQQQTSPGDEHSNADSIVKKEDPRNAAWQRHYLESRLPPGHHRRNKQCNWSKQGPTPPPGLKVVDGLAWGKSSKPEWEPKRMKTDRRQEDVNMETPMEVACEDKGESTRHTQDERMHVVSLPASEESETTCKNPFDKTPFFPTSSFGTPRLALNALYGKEMGKVQLTNKSFFAWQNEGPQHQRRYTCIFVCPVTFERFPAGRCVVGRKPSEFLVDTESGIVWFSKKKLAEHGAAARRYDCFVYRQRCAMDPTNENVTRQVHFGLDPPYRLEEARYLPAPQDIDDKIEAQIIEWKKEAVARAEEELVKQLEIEQEAMDVEEANLDRQAYREQRLGNPAG